MIEIVEGCVDVKWAAINPGATVYVGSLLSMDQSALASIEGVIVRPVGAGVSNTTNKDAPLGVCIGTNRREPVFSSTYLADYITDEGTTGVRSSTTDYVGVEGPYGKGSKMAMAQVAMIGPGTILKAPLRGAAIGTLLTVGTSSAGNANGLTVTTGALQDSAPVAGLSTIYCRSGLNAGQYRITSDTSATVHTWVREMLKTTATTGETYVKVPLRPFGTSYVTFGDGTACSFIDCTKTSATHYDVIHVLELNLEEAGKEFVKFRFDGDAFCTARA